MNLTRAQALVYGVLTNTPQTPAELKRRLPGNTPVQTIRDVLGNLISAGLVVPGVSPTGKAGTTGYARTNPHP